MKPPIKGMKVIPEYYNDPIMMGAWIVAMKTAITVQDITERFTLDTGHDLKKILRANGIEKIIDESTGYTEEVFLSWCDWFTKNVWGENRRDPKGRGKAYGISYPAEEDTNTRS